MDNTFFIALFLLMMEVLPLSARNTTSSHRHRVKKRTQAHCVGGKWVQVGSFRFWERSKCAQRRDGVPPKTLGKKEASATEGSTIPPTTLNFDKLLPSMEGGPKRNPAYDPNYGHEPYWAQGDWVFDEDAYVKDKTLFMCGVRCPEVYTEYGRVCGRNKDYKYVTYQNYCELRNADCSDINLSAAGNH